MEKRSKIVRLFHVHKRYGAKHALNDLTLDVEDNQWVFITGPSGAGKSTLLKLLYLGEPLSEGQIIVDGANISRIRDNQVPYLRRKFGVIFQDFKLIPTRTVFSNVALVLEAAGRNRAYIKKKVENILRHAGMADKMDAYPPSLSGGEQQRVAVARAIAGDPRIILADEPTGSLDPESAGIIMKLLQTYHSRGATVIIATHDKELLERPDSRIIKLKDGKLEDSGIN